MPHIDTHHHDRPVARFSLSHGSTSRTIRRDWIMEDHPVARWPHCGRKYRASRPRAPGEPEDRLEPDRLFRTTRSSIGPFIRHDLSSPYRRRWCTRAQLHALLKHGPKRACPAAENHCSPARCVKVHEDWGVMAEQVE